MRRNPLTALWAEMHPSWLQEPEIRTTFHEWLHAMLPAEREEYPLWALLHWMQPALTLESLFLSLKPQEAIRMQAALLEQLFQPAGLIAPNARRHQALLTDLTLIDADFAQTLWHIFSNTDAMRIAHADALYLGGHTNRAISLLEQELPEEATARRQVRQRLIQWLELEPSIPHRLALAWESRSISELLPVRHLLDAAQWNAIMIATETESAAASKDDWG